MLYVHYNLQGYMYIIIYNAICTLKFAMLYVHYNLQCYMYIIIYNAICIL